MTDNDSERDIPVQITLTTELSRAGLLSVRRRIDELLEQMPDRPADLQPVSDDEAAAAKARATWQRLGAKSQSRKYLLACARQPGDFTIEEIASEMHEAHPQVLAYHRNVSRSSAAAEPRDVDLISTHRQGGLTRLSLAKAARDAILDLSKGDK
jgi:hypothetical protein